MRLSRAVGWARSVKQSVGLAEDEACAAPRDPCHRVAGGRRLIGTGVAVLFAGDEAGKQILLLGVSPRSFHETAYGGWPLVPLRMAEVAPGVVAGLGAGAWRMHARAGLACELGRPAASRAQNRADQDLALEGRAGGCAP